MKADRMKEESAGVSRVISVICDLAGVPIDIEEHLIDESAEVPLDDVDKAFGEALGYLWLASKSFDAAGKEDYVDGVTKLIGKVSRSLNMSASDYRKAVLKVARGLERTSG